MHKRSHMETSSLIVFLSILTIIIQFSAYYFFSSIYVILGVASLILILCTHILLEKSLTYESTFIYTLLTLFISVTISFLTYFGKEQYFLPYTNILIAVVVLNWLIPTLHCYFRNMLDYGSKIDNFNSFFRNNSMIFILFYLGIIIYGSFIPEAFPWAYRAVAENANFTPFWSLATQIEDYMNRMIPISDIVTYLLSRILLFAPYGFYIILILRRRPRILRFIALLLFPILIELLQYFLFPVRCDIDDIIYAFIGGLLGALWFHLTNIIYRAVSGRNFLAKDSDYRYSNSSLHF